MNDVVAMVPVRAGSERVENKNSRLFGDLTLLDLKLVVLKEVDGLSSIIVSTDCNICSDIAGSHGVEVVRRSSEYTSSTVRNDVHWRCIADQCPGKLVLLAQTTSPLVKKSSYEKAISIMTTGNIEYDSINSVNDEKMFLWLDGEPLNYKRDATPKSQDLPAIQSLNFAITLVYRETMKRTGNVVGMNPSFIVLDKMESLDIDEMSDFQFAEYLFNLYGLDFLLQ